MNSNNLYLIRRLNFENLIWIVIIIISLFDIYGDELIKKNLRYNDKIALKKANKLFLNITIFSILIYIYFFMRNYSDYKRYKNESYEVRLVGSTFILIGTLCFLYFQIKNNDPIDSTSNV